MRIASAHGTYVQRRSVSDLMEKLMRDCCADHSDELKEYQITRKN